MAQQGRTITLHLAAEDLHFQGTYCATPVGRQVRTHERMRPRANTSYNEYDLSGQGSVWYPPVSTQSSPSELG